MKVGDLAAGALRHRLAHGGLRCRTGPFVTALRSDVAALGAAFGVLYAANRLEADDGFADFHVRIRRRRGPRWLFRPQIIFDADGELPFHPFPIDAALPLFEWGLNWCIATRMQRFLIVHAAVVERGGRATILPGRPGSGKSTLCAALVSRGWRLLSDELALLSIADGTIAPLARPISLKNESIAVMRHFAPNAVFSGLAHNTAKGTVGFMQAPSDSVARSAEPARAAFIVFPRFDRSSAFSLSEESRGETALALARECFNYAAYSPASFDALCDLVDGCACYRLAYGDLDTACDAVAALHA
jgi:HprK-related kinase A